jgi:ferredoxin-like protein FixX
MKHYAMLLEVLSEKSKVIAQTYRKTDRGDGASITSIRSTHLCLQCGVISSSKDSYEHWKFKQHMFGTEAKAFCLVSPSFILTQYVAIDSHTGCLYCHLCRDFVYDTTLEELRLTRKPTSKGMHHDVDGGSI